MKNKILIGTGAVAYREWKGRFYPKTLPAEQAMNFYGETFTALELNNTFYRMITAREIKTLMKQAPSHLVIAVKAPQRITHIRRLKNCRAEVNQYFRLLPHFEKKLGPALFQLPPNFKQDLPRLKEFFKLIPNGFRIAFEFRHPSWFEKSVFDFLKQKMAALVYNDTDVKDMPFVSTTDWGFLRLRKLKYSDTELKDWVTKIRKTRWKETFVIFKHEEKATAPKLARRLSHCL